MGVFLTAFAFQATTAFFLWSLSWFSYRNLPPGPRPWPIIGNILLLRTMDFIGHTKKYGPIYTFWYGPRPFIVISGSELTQNALISQADVFSNRCQFYSTKRITYNFQTVSTSSGPLWRTLRRNLTSEVLSSTRVKSYKPVRDREFRVLLDRFREEARDNNDGAVPVLTLIRSTLFNVLNTICFGERMEESVVREIDVLMAQRFQRAREFGASNFFPVLRFFEKRQIRHLQELIDHTEALLMTYVVKTREAMRKGEPVSGRYLETLLRLQETMGRDQLTDGNIMSLCAELMNAGTDTTANASEWIIARIVSDGKVQRKLVEEIRTVLGDKPIEESDIERLPYLQAVVTESQRLDGVNFALPHAVSKPGVKLAGYDIPMNAVVVFRINSLHRDAKIWGDPQNFRPERFLEEMAGVDLTGRKTITVLPFGAGKRICPAMNLALLEIHMIVGSVVQNFELSNGRPGEVDLTRTSAPQMAILRTPLRARIRDRNLTSCKPATGP